MSHRDLDMLVLTLHWDGPHMGNPTMDVEDGAKAVEGEGAAALEKLQTRNNRTHDFFSILEKVD